MAQMYYAKISLNSHIYETKQYDGDLNLNDILDKLYLSINDKDEFVLENSYYKNDEEKLNKEIYNFSNLHKVKNDQEYYIVGNLVRRFPYFTERFDEDKRTFEKNVISDNSTSILFYMDVRKEVVTFCTRRNFGQNQFIKGFSNLINECSKNYGFQCMIINDPFSMRERLEKVEMISMIKSTIIPPNVNEDHFKELYDNEVDSLKEANISRKVSIFTKDTKDGKGINSEAKIVKDIIDSNQAFKKYERGYAKLEVTGKYKDGSKFKFNSDEDSPYITIIDDYEKENIIEFIHNAKEGIKLYFKRIIGNES